MTFGFKGIGKKLLVAFSLVAAVPILLVSLLGYHANRAALESQISSGLRALSEEKARNIAYVMRLKRDEAAEIAGASAVRQLRPDGLNAPAAIKAIQDQIDWTYYEIMLKSPDGGTAVDGIEVCDVTGAVVAGTEKSSLGTVFPPDYGNAVRKSGSRFRGITEDPKTGKVVMTFVEKIRSLDTQEFAGFVVLKVGMEALNGIVAAEAGLGKTEEAYLVDKDFFIMTRLKGRKGNVRMERPVEPVLACFEGKDATAVYENHAGISVLGATKYLSDQGWCLVHEIEAREAFAPVASLRRRIILLSAALLLAVLALAALVSRSLSRPILAVRDAALEIARGKTGARAPVTTRDEIGELAGAFNRMTDELVQAHKELARSNRDLEEFSYVASHDLQEPLRKIISYGNVLLEDHAERLGPEGRESVLTVQKAAGRMKQLIEALLEYSRVTRETRPLEPVSLGALVKDVCSDLETSIRESGGTVDVGPLPTVQADPIQMRQLFQNLIGNALKFSREGSPPQVVVRGRTDGPELEVTVSDNGIGFDVQFARKIFEPFQRLHTREQYKGTGIGLSVCGKIVDRHKGRITVASEPGKGSTFTIRLPVA